MKYGFLVWRNGLIGALRTHCAKGAPIRTNGKCERRAHVKFRPVHQIWSCPIHSRFCAMDTKFVTCVQENSNKHKILVSWTFQVRIPSNAPLNSASCMHRIGSTPTKPLYLRHCWDTSRFDPRRNTTLHVGAVFIVWLLVLLKTAAELDDAEHILCDLNCSSQTSKAPTGTSKAGEKKFASKLEQAKSVMYSEKKTLLWDPIQR